MTLSPYALTTVARLKSHLVRSTVGESDVTDRCIGAINSATAWMERRTGRKLKARNWRTAFTVVCDNVSGASYDVSGAAGDTIRRGDDFYDAVNGYVPIGTQVVSYESATDSFVGTSGATTPLSTDLLTFGSFPLVCDGTGESVLYVHEWPLVSVWAAYAVDSAGNRTALDITSARVDEMGGRLELPYDVFPEGEQNIELECRAGYEEPTTKVRGHFEEWAALERLCLRIAEIYYSDDLSLRGRNTDITMGGVSSRVNDFDMPEDVRAAIFPFVRTR